MKQKVLVLIFILAVIIAVFMMTEVTLSAQTHSGWCGADLKWELDTTTGVLNVYGTGRMYDYSYSYDYTLALNVTTATWGSYAPDIKSVVIGDSVTGIGTFAFTGCENITSVTVPASVNQIGIGAINDNTVIECQKGTTAESYAMEEGFKFSYPDDDEVYIDGGRLSYGFRWLLTDEYTLCIYGVGEMENYSYSTFNGSSYTTAPWELIAHTVKKIVIGDSVTSIGSCSFIGCTAAEAVIIPDSVTSIGYYAFWDCTSLTEIAIPTSVKTIGSYAFKNCTALKGVYINDLTAWCDIDFKTSSSNPLYNAHTLYLNGEQVTDLVIPDTVKHIGWGAFVKCNSIKSLTIPDSVETIGGVAFYDCVNLKNAVIGNSVTDIGDDAFYDCIKLNDITIGDSVTDIGANAFYSCGLTSLVLPDSVINIGENAFKYCAKISNTLIIPDSVISIGASAFAECASIPAVVIGSSVTDLLYSTFAFCDSLTDLTFTGPIKNISGSVFYESRAIENVYINDLYSWCNIEFEGYYSNPLFYGGDLYINGELLCGELIVSEDIANIGAYAFYNYDRLTDIAVGDSVKTIGEYAFYNNTAVKRVDIGASVDFIGDLAFNSMDCLERIDVDPDNQYYSSLDGVLFDKSKSTLIQYPIAYAVRQYTVPDTVTSIGTYAFAYSAIETITVPASVKTVYNNAFISCESLCGVYVEDMAAWCGIDFYNFESNPVRYAEKMYTFEGDYIVGVHIPDTVTSIGRYAFYNCKNIYHLTIPDSVTVIGTSAFRDCKYLNTVSIPESVTKIESNAFDRCPDVTFVCYKGSYAHSYAESRSIRYILHSFSEYVYNNDATCTSDGTKTAYCSCGCDLTKTVTVEGTMLSHIYSSYAYNNDATCYTDGTETSYCDYGCGTADTVVSRGTQLSHSFTEYNSNNDATCTSDGTETAYCDNGCATTDTVTVVDSRLGHSFTKYSYNNDATCTADGTTTSYCDHGCGETKVYPVAGTKLPHDYTAYVISSGIMLYECKCGDYYTVIIPESGHLFSKYVYNNDATCTEDGTETARCDCGCSVTDTRVVSGTKLGHSFGEYTYNGDATCMANGTETSKCTRCYTADTRVRSGTRISHRLGDYISNNDATCLADGTKTAFCAYGCGYSKTVTDKGTRVDHSFTHYVSDKNGNCLSLGTKTAECDYGCGAVKTIIDENSSSNHVWTLWRTLTEPTYDRTGIAERKCSVCSVTEQKVIGVLEYINPFTDVKGSHWFYDAVSFVAKKGYMNGMSKTEFSPNSDITREQFVLILANIAGVDTNDFKNVASGFEDVPTGQWYSGAVTWAVREGYVSGISADKFGRGQSIQRAALARMLYNYASKNGIRVDGRADLSAFGDAKEFDKSGNAWMVEPVKWAVDAGIISGMNVNGKNCVNPKGTATRAQAARMLMQFDELMK